jgi:ATP-dependent RNA helicase DDX35
LVTLGAVITPKLYYSGKTTQIPQYLYECAWASDGKIIACTQPRRVAATTVAQRVAEELSDKLGNISGYSIRFEDCTSENTRIKYMTDGLLFREAMNDPLLSKYSVIMVDEAHERSLYTDLLLGLLKKILKKRPDLKVIISSATLNAGDFLSYFNKDETPAYVLSVQGKMYPLDIYYLKEPVERNDYHSKVIETVRLIHQSEGTGDVLVFMTGMEEIEQCISELKVEEKLLYNSAGLKMMILPIYAGLSVESQMKVFDPTPQGYRKVVIATNIAEASITIEGIVFVVDTGRVKVSCLKQILCKIRVFDSQSALDTLIVRNVSQAAAQQRAGRAGRVKPGKVYRLYTEVQYKRFASNNIPDIQR